jgi:hypothetical protein
MFWFGLLLCALFGVELGGTAAGAIHLADGAAGEISLFVISINLAPWTGLGGFGLLAGARHRAARAHEAATDGPLPALQPVLARIETARAVGEGPDIPLRLGLTISPDDRPGYRVDVGATVNLMDMHDYRVGRILVAAYDPDRPWRVQILPPPADWAARAASAEIDSAPLSTLTVKPLPVPAEAVGTRRRRFRPGLYATAVGLLASVAVFWTEFMT